MNENFFVHCVRRLQHAVLSQRKPFLILALGLIGAAGIVSLSAALGGFLGGAIITVAYCKNT